MVKLRNDNREGKRLRGTRRTREDHKYEKDGWALAAKAKPACFELVLVADARGRKQRGWWTGTIWDFGSKRIGEPYKWQKEIVYLI